MRDLVPAFSETDRGVSVSLTLTMTLYYVTLAQNNQYPIEAYFGVVCPKPQCWTAPNNSKFSKKICSISAFLSNSILAF